MAVTYQQVPVTLDPFTPIPAEALPSAGLDDAAADLVVQLSADYTAANAIEITVSSSGPFVADVVVTPTNPPEEPFRVNWDFGDGSPEFGADDSDQHHTYTQAGTYEIAATVMEWGQPSFTLHTQASFDDTGTLL